MSLMRAQIIGAKTVFPAVFGAPGMKERARSDGSVSQRISMLKTSWCWARSDLKSTLLIMTLLFKAADYRGRRAGPEPFEKEMIKTHFKLETTCFLLKQLVRLFIIFLLTNMCSLRKDFIPLLRSCSMFGSLDLILRFAFRFVLHQVSFASPQQFLSRHLNLQRCGGCQ